MDHTGKLPGGIIGVTICIILLMAAALPILNAMIDTVDKETTGPGQVTESGTNAYDSTLPTYNYVEIKDDTAFSCIVERTATGYDLKYYENLVLKGTTPIETALFIISSKTAANSGQVLMDSSGFTIDLGDNTYTYPSPNLHDSIGFSLVKLGGIKAVTVDVTIIDSGGTHYLSYIYNEPNLILSPHCDGMPAATHGFVSGSPEAVMGDSFPQERVFKLDMPASGNRLTIDMRGAIGSDQRRFMLDNGLILDLDDQESPVKSPSKADSIPGETLKTTRSAATTAVLVWKNGASDLLAVQDVSSDWTSTWGEFQAPRDLEVPMLETVSHSGSLVTGWYIPIEWTHTGTGTVTVKTMIYSVLSVIPLILVVALFILVVRWMQAESGVKETDALLGGGRPRYDGWRDRR